MKFFFVCIGQEVYGKEAVVYYGLDKTQVHTSKGFFGKVPGSRDEYFDDVKSLQTTSPNMESILVKTELVVEYSTKKVRVFRIGDGFVEEYELKITFSSRASSSLNIYTYIRIK